MSSVAILGGTVRGNRQCGHVGSTSDPAYNADTGLLVPGRTKSPTSAITDADHVYSTALHLSGLDPAALRATGKGRNDRPPLTYIKR